MGHSRLILCACLLVVALALGVERLSRPRPVSGPSFARVGPPHSRAYRGCRRQNKTRRELNVPLCPCLPSEPVANADVDRSAGMCWLTAEAKSEPELAQLRRVGAFHSNSLLQSTLPTVEATMPRCLALSIKKQQITARQPGRAAGREIVVPGPDFTCSAERSAVRYPLAASVAKGMQSNRSGFFSWRTTR